MPLVPRLVTARHGDLNAVIYFLLFNWSVANVNLAFKTACCPGRMREHR